MPSQLHGTEKQSGGSDLAITSLRIERDRLERFRAVAAANRRTVTAELRWLIDRAIEESEQEAA